MKKLYLIVIALLIFSCQAEQSAESIIQHAIESSGGEAYKNSVIAFDFREHHYQIDRNGDDWVMKRIKYDSLETIADTYTMGSFSRTINDSLAKPADSMVFKYKESINSVFYFALLPYKLDDPAVIANRLPDEQIEGKKHYKMNKYAEVDSTDFPIIKLIFTGEAANTENFQLYLNELKQNYSSKQPIAIVFDATKAVLPGIKYQKMQAQWLKDNEQLMKDFCAGTAYVIPNRIIRNVLSAIFALQKQPVPYQICSHRSEAEDWVNSQLETLRS